MIKSNDRNKKLSFPTRPLKVQGGVVEEYIIPEEQKKAVLAELYIFEDVPPLDAKKFDLHEGKMFCVGDFRVIWEDGQNWLVSPYYPTSGGTVIDWMPPDFCDDEEEDESESKG